MPQTKRPHHEAKPSTRLVTWNSGGLHASTLAEPRQWLRDEASQHKPVHIYCVQETHWPSTSEFSDASWQYVRAGSGAREGGVVVMLRKAAFHNWKMLRVR